MKRMLSARIVFLLIATAGLAGQARVENEGTRNPLVGAWRLAWLEEQGADGKIHRADCTGLLVFTRDGHMSVQVMYRNPPADSPASADAAPVQYAQGGYEASYGTYQIDEHANTFNYHVEGALVRTLVGKDLPRAFELKDGHLVVKSTHSEEHWRVGWEHF